jgi:hypothetical protein
VGFGDRERDAIGDRIGRGIGNRHAALALAARRCAAALSSTCTAFTLACCRAAFARGDRLRASALAPRLAAATRKQTTSERGAKAKLGPEFERAVHGAVRPLREMGKGYGWPHGADDNHSQDAIFGAGFVHAINCLFSADGEVA